MVLSQNRETRRVIRLRRVLDTHRKYYPLCQMGYLMLSVTEDTGSQGTGVESSVLNVT